MTNMTEINKEYNAKSDVKDTESKTQVKSLRKNNKPMLNCNGDITHIPKDKSVVDYGCSNGCHSEVGFVCDCFNDDGITDHDCWMRFVTFFRVYYRSILTEMSVVINMDDYIPLIENLYNTDSEKMVTLFEYVVEDCILQAKQRQLDLINNVHSYRGSKIFVFNLIDGYHRLVFAACKLHPIFDFLGLKSFSKFKLSWRHYNEHLYYKHVYSEPEIQDVLPYCVSKLGQMNEAPEFNRRIIRQFFKFCETIEIVNHKYRILDEQFLDGLDTGNIKNWVRIKTQLKQLPSDVLNFTNKMLSSDCMNGSLTNSGDSKKCNADSSNKVSPKVNANVDVAKTITESAISGSNRKNIVADKMTNNNEVDKSSRVMDKRKRSSSEHIRELYNNDDHNYGQCAAHNNHCAGDAVSIDEYHFCICQIKNSFNDFSKEDLIKAGAAMQKNGICDCCQVKSAKIPSPENLNSPNSTTNNRKPKKEIPTTPTPHLNEELLNHLQKESTLLHCTVPSHGHRTTKPRLGNIRKCCNAGCPNPPVVGLSTLHVHKKQTSKENSCKNTCNGEKSHKEPRPPTPIPVPPTNNGNQSQSSTKSGQNGKTQQKVAQTRQPASQAPPKRCQHPKPHSKRNSKCLQPGDNVTVCSKHAEVGTKMMISHQHEHVACTEHSGGDESGSDVSSPQRHCDCCYCEVFGHGGPQAAPVSRNYQEMRERLRTLLSKKKEQKTEKHEQQQQTEWSADDFKMKFDDSDSDDFENFLQKKMRGENYQGDKPLQEILNFIEGTKGRNQKRAAKQARRKQRQVEEEERRRKEAEEAEQRKLQEKKRKEEEERRKEEQQKRKQEQARKLQEQKRKLEEEKRKQQLQLAKEQNSKSKKKKGNQQSLILSEIKMATAATNTIISSNSSSSSSTSKKKRRQTSFDISADATKCQQLNTDTSLSNGAKNGKSQKAKDRQSGKKSTSAEQEIVADSTKQKSVDKSQKKKSVSETFDVEQQSSSSSPQKQNRKKSAKQQLNGVVKEQRENKSQQQSNSVAAKKQQQNATKQQNTAGKQHNNGSGNDGKQQSLSKQQNSSSKPKQQQQNDSWNQAKQHAIPKQQALQPHNKQQQQQQQQRPKSQQATNAAKQQQQQDGSSKRQQNLAKQQFVNSQKQHQQQTNASKYHQQQQQNGAKQQQQRNINSQSVSVSAQSKKQQQQSSSCNGNSNNLFKQQQHKVQQSSPSQPMYESRHLQTICKNEMERTKQENSSDKMVTIKRVIEPDTTDTKVTITLRGNTPNEDKILYTLQNGQLCNTKKKNNKIGPPPPMLPLPPPPISSLHPVQRDISSMINTKSQQQPFVTNNATLDKITERLATLNLGPEITAERITKPPIMSTSSTSSTTELTTPTAIQINQAVNQISSRSRNNDFNFEDIKLPPGITITKVDPEKVQERKQIQQAKQHSQQQQFQQQIQSQPPIRQAIVTPTVSPSNVIVVGTDERDSYYNSNNNHSATEAGGKKKRRRRRKDTNNANMELNHSAGAEVNIHPVPPSSGIGNGALPLNMSNGFGSAYMNSGPPTAPTTTPPGFSTANSLFSSPSTDYRSSAPPAIIQMNGSMVTIRNPLMHQPFFGRSYEYHDGLNSRMGAGGGGSPIGNGNSGSAVGSGDTYKDVYSIWHKY